MLNAIHRHAQARHPRRMANGNPTPVEVVCIPRNPKLAFHMQIDHGERLVHLEIIHIGDGKTGSLKQLLDGRHGAVPHDARRHTHHGPVHQSGLGLHTFLLEALAATYQDGGCTISDAGGIPGRDLTTFLERGSEL